MIKQKSYKPIFTAAILLRRSRVNAHVPYDSHEGCFPFRSNILLHVASLNSLCYGKCNTTIRNSAQVFTCDHFIYMYMCVCLLKLRERSCLPMFFFILLKIFFLSGCA